MRDIKAKERIKDATQKIRLARDLLLHIPRGCNSTERLYRAVLDLKGTTREVIQDLEKINHSLMDLSMDLKEQLIIEKHNKG